MMARRALWSSILAFLFCVGLNPREASGQVSQAVYSDVKDVIEDLLTTEVSESVTPGIACMSGRRYGTAAGSARIMRPDKTSYTATLEATRHFPRTLQHIYNRQFGMLRTTLREESAGLAGYLVYEALSAARLFSPSTANPAELSLSSGNQALLTAISDQSSKAADSCTTDTQDACRPADAAPTPAPQGLRLQFAPLGPVGFKSCRDSVKEEFEKGTYGQVSSHPLDEACAAPKPETFQCDLGFSVRWALMGQNAAAEDYLLKAVALVIVELLVRVEPTIDQALVKQKLLLLLRQAMASDTFKPELDALLDALATTQNAKAILAQVGALHAEWRGAIDVTRGTLDAAKLLSVVAGASGVVGRLCQDKSTPACLLIRKVTGRFGGAGNDELKAILDDIKPIIAFAEKRQYREVAQLGVRYVFQKVTSGDERSEETEIYQRFAESVVMYVLDVADDQPPSDATRLAFRTAAVDLIQHLGEGGGVRRATFGRAILYPDFALRFSWSASYLNAAGTAGRVLASVNWLTLRFQLRRSEAAYAGLHVSLVDPVAPLSELALRKTEGVQYRDLQKVAWNMIAPRLDLALASPILSEHLAVAAGLSLRAIAPLEDDAATAETGVPTFRYRSVWPEFKKGGQWPRFLEFGFAAKYVL